MCWWNRTVLVFLDTRFHRKSFFFQYDLFHCHNEINSHVFNCFNNESVRKLHPFSFHEQEKFVFTKIIKFHVCRTIHFIFQWSSHLSINAISVYHIHLLRLDLLSDFLIFVHNLQKDFNKPKLKKRHFRSWKLSGLKSTSSGRFSDWLKKYFQIIFEVLANFV